MADRACHYCGNAEIELRPYGPGGSWLCFPCLTSSPDREAAAGAAFMAQLDAAEAISTTGLVAIGETTGPRPFDPREPCQTCGQNPCTETVDAGRVPEAGGQ